MIITTSKVFVKEDKFYNKIYLRVFYDERNQMISGNIHLKLVSETRNRLIGAYHYADKTLYIKRSSSKHLFRKNRSYGLNYDLISSNDLDIDFVHLTVDRQTKYLLPKSFLENYGSFLTFKQQGFEVQKFYPVDLMSAYLINNPNPKVKKTKPKEKPKDEDYDDKWERPLL